MSENLGVCKKKVGTFSGKQTLQRVCAGACTTSAAQTWRVLSCAAVTISGAVLRTGEDSSTPSAVGDSVVSIVNINTFIQPAIHTT